MGVSSDVVRAIEWARSAAVAIPAEDRAVFAVTGGDRNSWLNGLVTCDLAKLQNGEAKYGLFVEKKGRVLADAWIVADGERTLLAVPRASEAELRALLDKHLVMEDADLTPAPMTVEAVHGPRAADVLRAMVSAGAHGAPLDRTGLGGAVAFVDEGVRAAVASARDAALAEVGGGAGDRATWEAVRIDRRVPEIGVDFDGANYPQEAGLEKRAVSFDKGCYLGQEVVCMLELRGHVKQRLVAIRVDAAAAPEKGAVVADAGGEAIGAVTSATELPSGVVAIAMVKRKKSDDGAEVRVAGAAGTVLGVCG